jgi:hypothetical protein
MQIHSSLSRAIQQGIQVSIEATEKEQNTQQGFKSHRKIIGNKIAGEDKKCLLEVDG